MHLLYTATCKVEFFNPVLMTLTILRIKENLYKFLRRFPLLNLLIHFAETL